MNLELDRGRIPFGGEAVGVIPARCASTRFPDKPLALIAGVPMICWTFKSASQAASFRKVFVAAEDQVIVDAVHKRKRSKAATLLRSSTFRLMNPSLMPPPLTKPSGYWKIILISELRRSSAPSLQGKIT